MQALKERLESLEANVDEVQLVHLIADTTIGFLSSQIYTKGSGRLARIIANYLCAWCLHPVIIFPDEERQELKQAQANENLLRLYIARSEERRVGKECRL